MASSEPKMVAPTHLGTLLEAASELSDDKLPANPQSGDPEPAACFTTLLQAATSVDQKNRKTPRSSKAVPRPAKRAKIAVHSPTAEELEKAATRRAKTALMNWYERFNELCGYEKEHRNCLVPQKYEENYALGIVSERISPSISHRPNVLTVG